MPQTQGANWDHNGRMRTFLFKIDRMIKYMNRFARKYSASRAIVRLGFILLIFLIEVVAAAGISVIIDVIAKALCRD